MKTVIVLNQDQMGHGSRELGQKLLGNFLRKLPAMREVTAIVLYNTAVRLLEAGSPLLKELVLLEENGVDLHPCGTCVADLGVQLAAGELSDMDSILRELDQAEKVITL